MSISALSFSAKNVDTTSGSTTIGLRWTTTSSNPDASGFGGTVHLRRMDPDTGGCRSAAARCTASRGRRSEGKAGADDA